MLDFIKRILGGKEPAVIARGELSGWFDQQLKELNDRVARRLGVLAQNSLDIVASANANLGVLERAELKNKNIVPRVMSILQGNRESYVRKMQRFFSEVSFPRSLQDIPPGNSQIQGGA
ncbi:MAG: hypothetical protein ABH879_05035 [archaeon]